MPLKAVLIEDNENNRYLLTILLRDAGFDVMAAENGASGVELVRREKPDVVLLDIQMPEMDGYEVAAALKSCPESSAIPIVGVSSFAMPGDRDRAMRIGFAGYIEKPVDPEQFAESIAKFVRGAEGRP